MGERDDLVQRAHWGDLSGLNLAGLVRLSFESDAAESAAERRSGAYMSGRDIKGRDEQEKDCRAYVESRGGSYVHTYEEPDTSAFKRRRVVLPDGRTAYRVVRPVFEGALEDLKRGATPDGRRLDGIVVYDIDRLTRDNRHLEDAIEVVQHFNRPILDITGTLDLLTDNGRTVARIVVATYNKQSADTARRVKRKHRALEQAGIPTGGRRPFGWKADKRTLEPAEAEIIRASARRIIEGAPLSAIVADWNERGFTTPLGNKWVRTTVKNVFRNPRICGYRSRNVREIHPETGKESWRVEVVTNEEGEPVIGQFEPIISVQEWEAVTALIGSNPLHGRGVNSRTYLFTGTLRCGKPECGAKLRALKAHASRTKTPGLFYYACPSKGSGGCGGVSIPGPKVDLVLTEMVIAKYEEEARRRGGADEAPEIWPREEELRQVRDDIKDLTAAWRARPRRISSARYFEQLPGLEREEQGLVAEREAWMARTYSAVARPVDLRERWSGLTLPEKRAYIEEALISVLVHPANGKTRWNPDRLEPLWREAE
ncbi:recombinase family protein [Actinomadura atramentaria]|uniref:recombinase family protein n=1 Tax=Actinomadura atramentaria TaxID=1990 RepID=UPI000363A339|nr:recombinase family protein [Actinomadura atramentaria]